MSRTPRPALLLTGAVAALLAAGCTTTVAGTATPAGAPAPAAGSGAAADGTVAWVDQLCGGLLPFVRTVSTSPPLDTSGDADRLVSGLSTYLEQGGTAAETAIGAVSAVGPSPVADGDALVDRLVDTLTAYRATFVDARSRVDAIDTSDRQALVTELPPAIAPLEELATLADPTAELRGRPELRSATEQAPRCRDIETELR